MNHISSALDFPALWAKHVNNGLLDDLLNLYHEGAVLLSTFGAKPINTHEGLKEYFVKLSSKPASQVILDESSITTVHMGEACYSICGLYTFQWEVEGILQAHPSRFTFVINLQDKSPILHHHSSVVPVPAA